MPYSLKSKKVLVTGGSRGLGSLICKKFAAEGCDVAINYVSSARQADKVAREIETTYAVKSAVIQADIGNLDDNARLVKETVEKLGGLDIIVANASWTRFSDFGDLHALSHKEWNKSWAINVLSHLQLMQEAAPIFEKNQDGGVYLITSSIAGISTGGSSMAYSVTKAAGLHLMKCLASTQGPNIRVNAVLPGLLLTDWGLKYSTEAIEDFKQVATLKQETLLDDCAEAYIAAARNTSMTGQQIVVDSGLANGNIR